MGRRAAGGHALLLAAVVGLVLGLAAPPGSGPTLGNPSGGTRTCPVQSCPCLVLDSSVGTDLASLAHESWQYFLAVFAARCDCFQEVRLVAVRALGSRAAYFPQSAVVSVRVPATRAMLQSALVHEWGHHLEYQCAAHRRLRPAFLAAQRLALDTPWQADSSGGLAAGGLAETPAEQCAEAMVSLVLGGRAIPTKAHITQEAVEAVAAWAAGK